MGVAASDETLPPLDRRILIGREIAIGVSTAGPVNLHRFIPLWQFRKLEWIQFQVAEASSETFRTLLQEFG